MTNTVIRLMLFSLSAVDCESSSRVFFTYFLEIIFTCVFNVNSSNDHEKYSNYSLKMNHDDIFINKTNRILYK